MTIRKLEFFPDHFDASGNPDNWTSAGWWTLPLLALAVTAFIVAILFLTRKLVISRPKWVNMPRKRDWLALAPAARLRAFKPAEGMLLGAAVFMNLIFVSSMLDTYAVASGARTTLSPVKLILVVACLVVWLILSVVRIRQAIGDEARAARQSDPKLV